MIHQYKNNGYNIILDVNSGSIHVVDDVVYDTVALLGDSYDASKEEKIIKDMLSKYAKEELTEDDMKDVFQDMPATAKTKITKASMTLLSKHLAPCYKI